MKLNDETVKSLKNLRIQLVKELSKDLPHGFKKEIANRAGVSKSTVTKFINGQDNRKLFKAFTEYANEYIEETKKEAQRLGISY